MCQAAGASHMGPGQTAHLAHAGFVAMQDRCLLQRGFNCRLRGFERGCRLLDLGDHCPQREQRAEQISKHLTYPGEGMRLRTAPGNAPARATEWMACHAASTGVYYRVEVASLRIRGQADPTWLYQAHPLLIPPLR